MEDPTMISSSHADFVPAVRAAEVVIRDVETTAELHAVEDLQREIWGIPDLDIVPLTHLVAAKTAGGVLVGAFDGRDLVGFVYGFAAIEHGETTHHSHMLAVKPDHRGAHIGERLKLAQRDRVLAQGIKTVSWTFDPLRNKNAHLNFRKLGVTCDRYFADFYGEDATSFLHQNGTDRFWVTWSVASTRVEDHVSGKTQAPSLDSLTTILAMGTDSFPVFVASPQTINGDASIEIPSNFHLVETKSTQLAREWRKSVRLALTSAIDAGYTVNDFVRGERTGTYVLTRRST